MTSLEVKDTTHLLLAILQLIFSSGGGGCRLGTGGKQLQYISPHHLNTDGGIKHETRNTPSLMCRGL